MQVECDLMFFYKAILFHLIDRCTRWYAAKIVEHKTSQCLLQALDDAWVSIHGPMQEIILDGESGLMKVHDAKQYFERRGIKTIVTPVGQHVPHIDRRGELVRQQ